MDDIKRILVVSRMTAFCRRVIHYGISLSKKYGAKLYIIHVVHNPFELEGWNLPIPSLKEEYTNILQEAKKELDVIIDSEKAKGMSIKELIEERDPTREILKVAKEENIDLIIMLAHEEGHLEDFIFGRSNEEILRKMPCSVLMVKKEPEPVVF